MRHRPDMLDDHSLPGLEVVQLTDDPVVPSSHVYPEAQVFTSDSKRFVLHRPAVPHHGLRTGYPQPHRYWLCDVDDGFSMRPLTDEPFAVGPAMSPDDRWLYYFVDESTRRRPRHALKRVALDGTQRDTLIVLDTHLPGTHRRIVPGSLYPISTIRSDGRAIAISAPLMSDDATADRTVFGVIVFDLDTASPRLVLQGETFSNAHMQYSRSTDPVALHDLMVQQDHGLTPSDNWGPTGAGMDIHVVRDDGSDMRDVPWGRDFREYCSGHQCWWGPSDWLIGTMCTFGRPYDRPLLGGRPGRHAGHVGRATPGGVRNQLDQHYPGTGCFVHMAVDAAGRTLVTDAGPFREGGRLFIADLPEPGIAPATNWRYLLSPRSHFVSNAHIHPCMSPDGRSVLFNSDITGTLQAYLVRGW